MFSKIVLEILGAGAVLRERKSVTCLVFFSQFFSSNLLVLVVVLIKDVLQLGRHVLYSLNSQRKEVKREKEKQIFALFVSHSHFTNMSLV
jgi:hypothetical protein